MDSSMNSNEEPKDEQWNRISLLREVNERKRERMEIFETVWILCRLSKNINTENVTSYVEIDCRY